MNKKIISLIQICFTLASNQYEHRTSSQRGKTQTDALVSIANPQYDPHPFAELSISEY